MKNGAKLFLASGVGFGLGFIACRSMLTQRYLDMVDAKVEEESEKTREHYRKKLEEIEQEHEGVVEELIESKTAADEAMDRYRNGDPSDVEDVPVPPIQLRPPVAVVPPREAPPKHGKEDDKAESSEPVGNKYWTPPVSSKAPQPPQGNVRVVETAPETKVKNADDLRRSDPYVIPEDTFMTQKSGYEQITLTFYAENQVLANMNEQAVPTPTVVETLGSINNVVNWFLTQAPDPTVIYVRNNLLTVEFEIIWNGGMYSE